MTRVVPLRAEDEDAERKRFANLQARLALLGFTLHELSGGGFLIGKWNLSRYAPDLCAVGAFLKQVSAATK
jgi:hypothetical protein